MELNEPGDALSLMIGNPQPACDLGCDPFASMLMIVKRKPVPGALHGGRFANVVQQASKRQ